MESSLPLTQETGVTTSTSLESFRDYKLIFSKKSKVDDYASHYTYY